MARVDVRKEFGAAVRRHRRRLGISQEALAERAELHRTYITDVERGARNLSLESMSKLAAALGISIGSLFPELADEAGSGGPSVPGVDHHPVNLLLVEDDPRDLELALEAFGKAKLTNPIHVARDGAEALACVFGANGHTGRLPATAPSIVLLDLLLPKIHGMEVLRRIKADERTRKIHVVVLTGSRNDDHLREARQLGADGYIVKPVDFYNFSAVTPQLNCCWTLLSRDAAAADRR